MTGPFNIHLIIVITRRILPASFFPERQEIDWASLENQNNQHYASNTCHVLSKRQKLYLIRITRR